MLEKHILGNLNNVPPIFIINLSKFKKVGTGRYGSVLAVGVNEGNLKFLLTIFLTG